MEKVKPIPLKWKNVIIDNSLQYKQLIKEQGWSKEDILSKLNTEENAQLLHEFLKNKENEIREGYGELNRTVINFSYRFFATERVHHQQEEYTKLFPYRQFISMNDYQYFFNSANEQNNIKIEDNILKNICLVRITVSFYINNMHLEIVSPFKLGEEMVINFNKFRSYFQNLGYKLRDLNLMDVLYNPEELYTIDYDLERKRTKK